MRRKNLRTSIVLSFAWGIPLLAAGESDPTKEPQPKVSSSQLLQKDAPLAELIAGLTSKDFSTRMRAVDFIGDRGEEAKVAIPALVKSLHDSRMRESALHALKNIGPYAADAVPALFNSLTAYPNEPATRWIAAHALANVGDAAIPTLIKGTASDNVYERLWSHTALAKIEGPKSTHLAVLAKAMASEDKTTSLLAVEGLTLIGLDAKSVIPQMIVALDSPTTSKTDLAILLARMGKDAAPAIPRLVKLLDQPNAMTRQRAAHAISEIGGDESATAVPGLIRMLTAEEDYVREMAAKALGTVGPSAKDSIPALIERLHDGNEHVRAAAATSLGQISPSDKTVLIALIDAMKDESGRVRGSAARVLADHAPVTKETIDVFIRASEDQYRTVTAACETFFSRLEPKDRGLIPQKFREQARPQ
jgi:HEAT repeat protein